MQKIKNFTQTKIFQGVLIGILIVVVFLIVFQAGVFVGFRKASFAYQFGDNYYKMFEGRGPNMMGRGPVAGGMMGDDFRGGHGVVGKIIKISLPTVVVEGSDNLEKVVLIGNDTIIKQFRNQATSSDLKVGDTVVIIGTPNNKGQIQAKMVRLMPPPPAGFPGEKEIDNLPVTNTKIN